MDKVLLIDGLNMIHRANIFFNSKPEEDNSYTIVYNFFRNLRAMVEEFNPDKIFFCLEGANNKRYKIYPEYKANRKVLIKNASPAEIEKREKFSRQRDIIIKLISCLPITVIRADEYEADDVVSTLVENLKDEEVIIISNDTDYIQLLQKGYENLKIYNPFKKGYMSAPNYFYLSFKCLRGDKTDNISGILGPKKAEKLASDADALKEFLETEENRANYCLNKELIELKIIPSEVLEIKDYNVNFDRLKEEFTYMDFKTMIEEKYWNRFVNTFQNLR